MVASGCRCGRVGLGGVATLASLTFGGVGLGLVGDRDPDHALPHRRVEKTMKGNSNGNE